jgi:hypothetical protein
MSPKEIFEMICLHEAGHAVAAFFLQLNLAPLTANEPTGPGTWGGFEETPGPNISADDGNPEERERTDKLIMRLLAGPAAECRYTHASPFMTGGSDLPYAIRIACRRCAYETETTLREHLLHLWDHTKALVYEPEKWECIERIGNALEQTHRLEPAQWTEIIHDVQTKRRNLYTTEVMRIMHRNEYDRIEQALIPLLKP